MTTRRYSLVIDGGVTGYSAYVPELPSIQVSGRSMEEVTSRAAEAIRDYLEYMNTERSSTSTLREVEVEVPV